MAAAAFSEVVRHTSWKVEISLREDDSRTVHYFANEGLAKLAVEWAYAVHVEKIRSRSDASEIEEYPDPSSGAWKIQELYGKKLVWWQGRQETRQGFIAMKDYFTAEEVVFEREVLG